MISHAEEEESDSEITGPVLFSLGFGVSSDKAVGVGSSSSNSVYGCD